MGAAGQRWDALDESVRLGTAAIKGPSLDAVIGELDQIIGELSRLPPEQDAKRQTFHLSHCNRTTRG